MEALKKTRIKQGTLLWEKTRASRIGSSEVFDIVRYYASEQELLNCGIDAVRFKEEKPYTTAWALYHKMRNDGVYKKEALSDSLAEYGHALEPYGVKFLQKGRELPLRPGEVYLSDRLIASLDISGFAEECDLRKYDYGTGMPAYNDRFVCEQKTMMPFKVKDGLPYKYIIQAQYQISKADAKFFILQLMVLNDDNDFLRGKICQMSKKKRFEYLDENLSTSLIYFANNEHLSRLIDTCLERFFSDVDAGKEPKAYIETDSVSNILESIRINTFFDANKEVNCDLSLYSRLKEQEADIKKKKDAELSNIINLALERNSVKFKDGDTSAIFDKRGRFLLRTPSKDKDLASRIVGGELIV